MRGATEVTLQRHQIVLRLPRKRTFMSDPRHIWNVIYNARSNRCHPPTSPNTAPATKNDFHEWSSSHMKRYLQCAYLTSLRFSTLLLALFSSLLYFSLLLTRLEYESNFLRIYSQTNLLSHESILRRIYSLTNLVANLFSYESILRRIYCQTNSARTYSQTNLLSHESILNFVFFSVFH